MISSLVTVEDCWGRIKVDPNADSQEEQKARFILKQS